MIRAGRAEYPEGLKAKTLEVGTKGPSKHKYKFPMVSVACEHVDYKTSIILYIPKSYNPAKAAPLLLVGHGGNNAMAIDGPYAPKAAVSGIIPWLPTVEKHGMILAAPLTPTRLDGASETRSCCRASLGPSASSTSIPIGFTSPAIRWAGTSLGAAACGWPTAGAPYRR